ncbi:MAG: heavy metal translocating P-type ATPase [Pirellulales bacterium]
MSEPSDQASRAFRIHGMHCAEEVSALKSELGPLVGGADKLAFDLLGGKLTIASTNGTATQQIVDAVARAGMRAAPWTDDEPAAQARDGSAWSWRGILTAVSGVGTLAGFLCHAWLAGGVTSALTAAEADAAHAVPLPAKMLYGLAILAGVWLVLPKAANAVRRLRPDMNLLMTIAVVGAVAIGEWLEAATVAFLFSLSLLLESWSVSRARRAIGALLDLTPAIARVRNDDGTEITMPPQEVPVGATLIVKPGERFPLDGRVVAGVSHVNQAPVTGESSPVEKGTGDEVFAGTINGDGALTIESTKDAGHTTLANIIRMVGEAHARRAPSEQWVEKFAQIYTPVVMLLALAVWLVPPLLFAQPWSTWIYNALVLLVIACPCALVIATPVSIVAALTSAARAGVLIKGGVFVEAPARLRAIAFDKTGTLTEGKPTVVEMVPLSEHDERELLERAAALESRSEHPLAQAILVHAKERGVTPAPADDFQVVMGKGATASFQGRTFWLGSHRYLHERDQETDAVHAKLEQMSAEGRTVVVVGNEDHVCGLIALADAIRPQSRSALDALRQVGIERLVMLTGDNYATAEAVARQTGIDDFQAELMPEDKVDVVANLVNEFGTVAMVGDGVNDAPALARATLGIAMGAAGSDAAIETADIALMSDDLGKLAWLVRHSRRTLRVIRQNIVFALAIKALFVVLTFAGLASLWAAIAADTGASLLVILNGLRLLQSENR